MSPDELCGKMQAFTEGRDCSLAIAGEIEVGLEELFGDAEPYASLGSALASYRPGGGEYLYDEAAVIAFMKPVLAGLVSRGNPNKQ